MDRLRAHRPGHPGRTIHAVFLATSLARTRCPCGPGQTASRNERGFHPLPRGIRGSPSDCLPLRPPGNAALHGLGGGRRSAASTMAGSTTGRDSAPSSPPSQSPSATASRFEATPYRSTSGLIFAYLGEGEPPEMRRYPEFEEPGIIENGVSTVWPCNYFNRLENSPDPVHLAFVHRSSPFTDSGLIGIPTVAGERPNTGLKSGRSAAAKRCATRTSTCRTPT